MQELCQVYASHPRDRLHYSLALPQCLMVDSLSEQVKVIGYGNLCDKATCCAHLICQLSVVQCKGCVA